MTETSAADRLGQVISARYRLQEVLGEGGMGAVYLAEHTLMRKRVALKLLHAELVGDEQILARFRREAEAAAHIEHPNVAAAKDFGRTDDGSFFLVLEYVEGTSLRKALDQGPFPVERALRVARQIALGLERAHAAGIVHRDLKPENVMLVKKGDDPFFVKVLDFGIARFDPASARGAASGQPLTRMGTILGTPEYMSPEQAAGDVVGPGADLYAVGVMLFEMLTGKHPFEAGDGMEIMSMHIIAPVPAMSERAPEVRVDPAIESVVRKLLEKETQNRYPNARALVDALDSTAAACGFARDTPAAAVDAFAKTSYGTPAVSPTAPTPLPQPAPATHAKTLPRNALLAAVISGSLALGALVVVVVSLRSAPVPSDEAARGSPGAPALGGERPRTKLAGKEKIDTASGKGIEALEALSKEHPNDAQVHRALALALNEKARVGEALEAIRVMTTLGSDGLDAVDADVIGIVVGATGLTATADQAFALLEGPLGAAGVDALIDIAQMKSSPALAHRATRSLAKPDVRKQASPAAAVLLDMKTAKTCQAKRELLPRAGAAGDARMLAVLVGMKDTRGCGFMGMRDCWTCLRKDKALDDAIGAIEARAPK